jgi:hypothetical protein
MYNINRNPGDEVFLYLQEHFSETENKRNIYLRYSSNTKLIMTLKYLNKHFFSNYLIGRFNRSDAIKICIQFRDIEVEDFGRALILVDALIEPYKIMAKLIE